MSSKNIILSIEDDASIRKFLQTYLARKDFIFHAATTAAEGLQALEEQHPDLILLDLGLPDMDGLEVIKTIRRWSEVPIIVISARGKEQDKVLALNLGADDYLTKPFGVVELIARIHVALRHKKSLDGEEPVLEIAELKIDQANQTVFLADQEIKLSPKEYLILAVLAKNLGKVVTNERLLQEVWGTNAEKEYLRIYVHKLRRKLETEPTRPKYLHTRTGVGYQLWCDDLPTK